jgi:hypothetical protein
MKFEAKLVENFKVSKSRKTLFLQETFNSTLYYNLTQQILLQPHNKFRNVNVDEIYDLGFYFDGVLENGFCVYCCAMDDLVNWTGDCVYVFLGCGAVFLETDYDDRNVEFLVELAPALQVLGVCHVHAVEWLVTRSLKFHLVHVASTQFPFSSHALRLSFDCLHF